MLSKLLGSAAALIVLIAVPVAAETYAGATLEQDVRAATSRLAPGAAVSRAEPRGRPFIASLLAGEVSSAYVDLSGPAGRTTLILQRLDRNTGRVERALCFARLRQPVPLTPVPGPGGADSPFATAAVDGVQLDVTYEANVEDGQVVVAPSSVTPADGTAAGTRAAAWARELTPGPVESPLRGGATVRAVTVAQDGITVELQLTGTATGPPGTRVPRG